MEVLWTPLSCLIPTGSSVSGSVLGSMDFKPESTNCLFDSTALGCGAVGYGRVMSLIGLCRASFRVGVKNCKELCWIVVNGSTLLCIQVDAVPNGSEIPNSGIFMHT
jgi:hypothetical protein